MIKRNKKGTHKLFGILKILRKIQDESTVFLDIFRYIAICNVLYVYANFKVLDEFLNDMKQEHRINELKNELMKAIVG